VDLQTGDIILTAKNKLLIDFMDYFQNDPVIWSHVLIVKDEYWSWEAYVLLRETSTYRKLEKANAWKILRRKDITNSHQQTMLKTAPKLLGHPYGVSRIILQIFDHIFKTNIFTKYYNGKYAQVCSSYAAWIYWVSMGIKFNNVGWQSCDPDDIEDDYISNPDNWEVVGEYDPRTLDEKRRILEWRNSKKLMK